MTPILFAKPLDTVTAEDVCAVVEWPESGQVEYKRAIPGRDGKPDPWVEGKEFAAYGRDKLFKEVVAFANTTGGTLILGIAETAAKPPAASAVPLFRDARIWPSGWCDLPFK